MGKGMFGRWLLSLFIISTLLAEYTIADSKKPVITADPRKVKFDKVYSYSWTGRNGWEGIIQPTGAYTKELAVWGI